MAATSFSLYDATVSSYLQALGAVSGLLDTAESFCADQGIATDAFIQERLADDMAPFSYQVKSTVVHSVGAIEGVRKGVFSPDMTPPPASMDELRSAVSSASATLSALDRDEVEGFIGNGMKFVMGEREIPFTAENFLLSFSLPNFYFHATTVYDILRWKGAKIGKLDFLGALRIKRD